MLKITIVLSDRQSAGVVRATALRNADIETRNESVRTHNENLKEGEEAGVEEMLFTAETYLQSLIIGVTNSYADQAESEARNSRFEKIAALDAVKLAQVDAILK